MNREIKFRAWLEGKHEGLSFTKPTMDYDVVLSKNGHWCDVESGWDIQGEYESIPIMQFTGLQDKTGRDIYEGDIVKHSGIICKVVYGKKGACFSLFDVRLGETDLYVITELSSRYMEVIGNEFENPELLTPQS